MTVWYGSLLLGDRTGAHRRRCAAGPHWIVEPRASTSPNPGRGLNRGWHCQQLCLSGPRGGAWPSPLKLNHQHSPTPQKLTVGCCLLMFASLLNTDFSSKYGKVILISLNLKWKPSFLDWERKYGKERQSHCFQMDLEVVILTWEVTICAAFKWFEGCSPRLQKCLFSL